MGRLERNIRRRKRRRTIIFSLLAILLLFVSGIVITNSVMVQMTGLTQEENIFSQYNIRKFMRRAWGFINETQWITDVKIMMENWVDKIQKVLERTINII